MSHSKYHHQMIARIMQRLTQIPQNKSDDYMLENKYYYYESPRA